MASIAVSDASNAILFAAVRTQMEGGAEALPLLLSVGYEEEKATSIIEEVKQAIIEDEKAEGLKVLKDSLVESLVEAGNDLWSAGQIPPDIEVMSIDVWFYKDKTTLASGQVVDKGFYVGNMKAHFTGVEKAVTIGKIAKKPRKGNGRSKVPCPEGITSWNAHLKATYPDRAKELEGKSYSAPRELITLQDATYLGAAAAAKEKEPETTESE